MSFFSKYFNFETIVQVQSESPALHFLQSIIEKKKCTDNFIDMLDNKIILYMYILFTPE